ncbi:MAG: nucleoside-binding protein, partial [Gemmatimonadales bacterium]|nr:nucleoside-binding protein [Gemmatimonadales bacterium]
MNLTARSLRGLSTVLLLLAAPAAAAGQAEFQLQLGKLVNPFTDTRHGTTIVTFQHAAQWSGGDHFMFFDYAADGGNDGFNEKDLYGE